MLSSSKRTSTCYNVEIEQRFWSQSQAISTIHQVQLSVFFFYKRNWWWNRPYSILGGHSFAPWINDGLFSLSGPWLGCCLRLVFRLQWCSTVRWRPDNPITHVCLTEHTHWRVADIGVVCCDIALWCQAYKLRSMVQLSTSVYLLGGLLGKKHLYVYVCVCVPHLKGSICTPIQQTMCGFHR